MVTDMPYLFPKSYLLMFLEDMAYLKAVFLHKNKNPNQPIQNISFS